MVSQEFPRNSYYINNGRGALGPFTLDDLQEFVNYGLISRTVLVHSFDNVDNKKPLEYFLDGSQDTFQARNDQETVRVPIHSAYYVYKEDDILGPFTIDEVQAFVHSGLLLKRDTAFKADDSEKEDSVKYFLTRAGLSCKIEHRGTLFSQIKSIGKELILPHAVFTKEPWKNDNRLFLLSLVGLSLSLVLVLLPVLSPFMVFYIVALYFSCIWAIFFNFLFKTSQVNWKLSITIFFICQAVVFLVWDLLKVPGINPFYHLLDIGNHLLSIISYIFGVGLTEEFFKLLPCFLILHFSKNVMKPQTMVYYGLISGVSFGVFEGVQYQLGANFQIISETPLAEGYVVTFILNIARLTYLPFLHAMWCGISSYFCAFAFLYPRYRKALLVLSLFIPSILHGLYDFTTGISTLLTIPIVLITVILLIVYLHINYSFNSKLAD